MSNILYGQGVRTNNVYQLPIRRPAGQAAISDDAKKALIGIGAAAVLAGAAWGLWKIWQ